MPAWTLEAWTLDLTYISYAITGFFMAYLIYYIALFAASCRNRKKPIATPGNAKFLVLVPARN